MASLYRERLAAAQRGLAAEGLDGMLLAPGPDRALRPDRAPLEMAPPLNPRAISRSPTSRSGLTVAAATPIVTSLAVSLAVLISPPP